MNACGLWRMGGLALAIAASDSIDPDLRPFQKRGGKLIQVGVYTGTGSIDDAANFVCKEPD